MISFKIGQVPDNFVNSTVWINGQEHRANYKRTPPTEQNPPGGDLVVTYTAEMRPEHGDSVKLVLHEENNATYEGKLDVSKEKDGPIVFVK